jgi:plasmid stabilization system protein ParE
MKCEMLIRKEAEHDIDDAFRWYEQKRPGLGSDFLLCVEEGLARISRDPAMYPLVHKDVRRTFIRRFTYGIFYFVDERSIVVLAVSHAHRDARTWRSRV